MSRLKKLWAAGDIETYRRIFVIAALRRASYRWPARTEAMGEARIKRGEYRCSECGTGGHGRKDVQMDHVNPVIDVGGFSDWNSFVLRLLPSTSGWQLMCKPCHLAKSKAENVLRRSKRAVRGGSRTKAGRKIGAD